MTTLLEDVVADREKLEAQTRALAKKLLIDARVAINNHVTIHPVVGSVIAHQAHLWSVRWDNVWDRKRVLSDLNEYLKSQNATSIVFAHAKDHNLVLTVETPAWREMAIMPFDIDASGTVKWGEPSYRHSFTTPFTRSTCVN